MKKMLFSVLLLQILGSFGQEGSGLAGKQLVFPKASDTAHVVLKATPKQPLTSFTVCLAHYTDLTRPYTFFSYASRTNDNDIVIVKEGLYLYSLNVGGEVVTFRAPEAQLLGKVVLCASWDSTTGLAEFWMDSQRMPRKGLRKGYSISAEASIVLGQDQDIMGGGFDINDCYVGELQDVRMWDRVLSHEELQLVWLNQEVPGDYIFNWETVNYEIKGYC
ncbi:mucosal pentraxin-like [Rhineura floridana]|uniref:mucosal pentraxin-like n=1 Tax=Rhineura floridana TaxID=261503 RepID=UPI002AC8275B|nr:mucosal pentraxin-like [Rhineura floridana]XP_061462084.1 mucosal pentraxin-like [Rhineura floridana]